LVIADDGWNGIADGKLFSGTAKEGEEGEEHGGEEGLHGT
jgi:hypothetical protein